MKNWKNFIDINGGELFDFVKCSNCDFIGGVSLGAETCPGCRKEGSISWVDENQQELDVRHIEDYLDKHYMSKERLLQRLEEEGCSESGLSELGVDYIVSYVSHYSYIHPMTRTKELGYIFVQTADGIVQLPFFENNTEGGYEQLEPDFATLIEVDEVEMELAEAERRAELHRQKLSSWTNAEQKEVVQKDKYVVYIPEAYVRDVQCFCAPNGLTDKRFDEFQKIINDGINDFIYFNESNYGWLNNRESKLFLGVVDATSEADAKTQFNLAPQTLAVKKI